MSSISAKDVAELRRQTGAGMMDCKKALTEAEGSPDKAIEILRIKGIAKAAGKSERKTSEGLVSFLIAEDGKSGVMVEVNCETDFVARTDDFKGICGEIADHLLHSKTGNVIDESCESLLEETLGSDPSKTIKEFINAGVAKLGENMRISRYARFEVEGGPGIVNAYSHMGGKAGVLILASTESDEFVSSDMFKELTEEVAIHICAYSPDYISPGDIPEDALEKEKAIYREQALSEGKPEAIVEKIILGRINKFYSECCLLKQAYYRDETGKEKVEEFINKSASGNVVTIDRFARFQLGS